MDDPRADLQIDGNSHDLLVLKMGSVGAPPVQVGVHGWCRFCGTEDRKQFRSVAHTAPEALGNKWLISRDECDRCNRVFSRYDDALAKAFGAILTVGGTRGKSSVRQSGRSDGPVVIKHTRTNAGRRLSVQITGENPEESFAIDPTTGEMLIDVPVPLERFVPRHAYKAISKIGLSLLPEDELPGFSKSLAWVLDPKDGIDLGPLYMGVSFGSLGNAPPLIAVALLRRTINDGPPPSTVVVVSVGSICFQLSLLPDTADGPWPPEPTRTRIKWINTLGDQAGRSLVRIEYSQPVHFDWQARLPTSSPLKSLQFLIDTATSEARIVPNLRSILQD